MNDEPDQNRRFPAAALIIGFLPAAALLWIQSLLRSSESLQIFWLLAAGTLVCCFASSYLLFRHKTVLAVLGGIFFLLLNGAIAFFFGCGALLSGMI